MNVNIKVVESKPNEGIFKFGNISSEIGANSQYFTLNGEPIMLISGEFHFSRYDYREWERALRKMKASGVNTIATYIFWNHHEYNKGEYDFTGNRNIKLFLKLCRKVGVYVSLRIGPWAHGECLYGGFPPFIQKMTGKRCDNNKYLAQVEIFWRRLYKEVAEYCDGKTVIAIQLENEYGGNISHIHTLRSLAEKIGFTTPFFTMTGWPTNTPDLSFLPTFGGYPDAPWSHLKTPLKPVGRFAICEGRMESEIGEDLVKTKGDKASFVDFPYAGCEVGCGNQVSQHRRPIIKDKDGYGVPFAKLASGTNWIGYYIYYGGRNPNDRPLQESRRTMYPNNMPMIDYDFQSPFGKNGERRIHCDKLRIMHLFLNNWDKNFATKMAYFGDIRPKTGTDNTIPYYSVRCNGALSGYCFVSNYERGRVSADINNFNVTVTSGANKLELPTMNVKNGALFFYPFNFNIDDVTVDYVTAQPIVREGNTLYFMKAEGITPMISIGGNAVEIKGEHRITTASGECKIVVLDEKKALELYYIGGKVLFSGDTLYEECGEVVCENMQPSCQGAKIEQADKIKLPHGYYLYSYGKRKYYKLTIDKALLQNDDVELEFDFTGLNLQVFSNETIIDDYFNTDGKYIIRLRMFYDYLKANGELIIKTVPPMAIGVGNVYNEINLSPKNNDIKLNRITPINYKTL